MAATKIDESDKRMTTPPAAHHGHSDTSSIPRNASKSPYGSPVARSVAFELLFPESPQYRARLPMRVQIFPHDTTESIVTTVKNFYGLYAGPGGSKGISFEDQQGNTLIPRYENLHNGMVVYVRVTEEPLTASTGYRSHIYASASPAMMPDYVYGAVSEEQMSETPQIRDHNVTHLPPAETATETRSLSPNTGRGRRSESVSTNPVPSKKPRSRSNYKSRASSTHGNLADMPGDVRNGYSSGDGGPGSVSSRTKSEQLGNTEISLDNIVEGGRRKRAKFESSELPLFAPPQMPAATSNSSVSPARRIEHQRAPFPFTHPQQHPFAYPQMLHSSQNYHNTFGQPGIYQTPVQDSRHGRNNAIKIESGAGVLGNSSGILPTPEPTVGSCMSEEDKDVALQLMRLGEMSNMSHGRTSASTLDDTFSGRADATSSTGATSESESDDEMPTAPPKWHRASSILPSDDLKEAASQIDGTIPSHDHANSNNDVRGFEIARNDNVKQEMHDSYNKQKAPKAKSFSQTPVPSRENLVTQKPSKIQKSTKSRSAPNAKTSKAKSAVSDSPTTTDPHSRKNSISSTLNFHHQLGEDEEDLSSKPRCQRCRKSKKGCDRQRPCQRCKDAGLSADQCVSEDEGNGRKGRYGRHMGVPVKKDDMAVELDEQYQTEILAGNGGSLEKSKKRKR